MLRYTVATFVLAAIMPLCLAAAAEDGNLVANPRFAQGEGDVAANWTVWRPLVETAACTVRRTDAGLVVRSEKEPYGVGGAWQEIKGIQPGKSYAVAAEAALADIASPLRSVMVRLEWTKGGKKEHPAGWLVRLKEVRDGAARFEDMFTAPEGADAARLVLEVKWPGSGSVTWKSVSLKPVDSAPPPRKVRLGAVYMRPRNSTPEKNLALWIEKVDAAGRLKVDALCLGEAILQVGTQADAAAVAEPVPGPTTAALGEAARRNRMYVIATISERAGPRIYNTAVLLDREGRLAGTYRKVHLPREEWQKGIAPGGTYPVFDADFGRIAIMICYDWFFPEAAGAFALGGAEVLFAPTWGTTLPDADGRAEGETVFRVRARDNGIYLVPCVYDGSSMVIDPMGRVLASNKGEEGVFWADVDLVARERLFWVGRWRDIGPRDRMPETYGHERQ